MDNTLILTVGLPRAGKSTWARKSGFPVVNPDSIRLAMHGHTFLAKAEPFVWAMARVMVESLFLAGHATVVLDATNVSAQRRSEWQSTLWTVQYRCFYTPVAECVKRAIDGKQEELVPVIERMAKSLTWPAGADFLPRIDRLHYLENVQTNG